MSNPDNQVKILKLSYVTAPLTKYSYLPNIQLRKN